MKAFLYHRYGGPEVLEFSELEKPVPKDDEILVQVHATSVNRTDCANLTAKPDIMRLTMGLRKPRNPILGTEFAGLVEEVGAEVSQFKAGDKVFGFNDSGLRSYAEYLVISTKKPVAIMPEGMSFMDAAGCIEGMHYAYNFINKVALKPGDKVMVNGASGGIGTATLQLLKHFGAQVTATGNPRSLPLLKELGSQKQIDYTQEDFTQDADQYDFVFDSVGKSSFDKCKYLLKPGGAYISSELGKGSQNVFLSLATAIFGSLPGQNGKKVKFPFPPDILRSIEFLKKLVEAGEFKAVVDRVYPFEEIPAAFEYVLQAKKNGNVVIDLGLS